MCYFASLRRAVKTHVNFGERKIEENIGAGFCAQDPGFAFLIPEVYTSGSEGTLQTSQLMLPWVSGVTCVSSSGESVLGWDQQVLTGIYRLVKGF